MPRIEARSRPERALRAAESDHDEWGDLRAQTQALAEQAEDRLRARESASGQLVTRPARGEVWWGETLTHGRRPYIVLTRDEAIEKLDQVIVVPLTTTVRDLPNEVQLDQAEGMPRACVTSIDNLSTIAKGQLVERITVLGPAKMDEVCRGLDTTVAC